MGVGVYLMQDLCLLWGLGSGVDSGERLVV